jgi:hypothetical protein
MLVAYVFSLVMWLLAIMVICFAIGWAVTAVVVPVKWLIARSNRNDYHSANH